MNATQALNIQLAALVAVYGFPQVQKALARIDEERIAQVGKIGVDKEEREKPMARAKEARPRRSKKGVETLVQEAEIEPSVRSLVMEIGHAYERRTFLPDLWRVKKFLESEGIEAGKLRSRSAALRKVINVLARLSRHRLQDLLAESKDDRGELAILTDQILGRPASSAIAAKPSAEPATDSTTGR